MESVLTEVAETVQALVAQKENVLKVNCAPDLGQMHSDVVKVRQSLLNLLGNASKFTERGEIELSATRTTSDGNDELVFRVTDTGIGMSAEQLDKLFRRFTQADASTTRKFGGTGLGLAITKAFCTLLGGSISVGKHTRQGHDLHHPAAGGRTVRQAGFGFGGGGAEGRCRPVSLRPRKTWSW